MKSDMNDWQLGSGAAAIATKLHYFNTDFDLEDICWSPAASTVHYPTAHRGHGGGHSRLNITHPP